MSKIDKAAQTDTALAVVEPSKNEVVAGSVASAMEEFAGAGSENVTTNDILIPRIAILQQLSPQIDRKHASYIEGAQTGDFCDVGLGELIEKPLHFIPLYFMTQFLEWKPKRAGLAGIHSDPAILQRAKQDENGKWLLPNGNSISETAQFYGLNVNADYRLSFIPMTSTQLKKARLWNTMMTGEKVKRADGSEFTPPYFYRSYILTTVPERNDQGSWDGWKIDRGPKLDDMGAASQKVFDLAVSMYKSIKAGRAKADLSQLQDDKQDDSM